MQAGPVEWDAIAEPYGLDLTTKLTALYLMVSMLGFLVALLRFLPIRKRLRASVALLRAQKTLPADAGNRLVNDDSPATQQCRSACTALQVALARLRRWMQLTVLILLAYSAREIANLLREISMSKMAGISALSRSLGQIFSMWRSRFGSW
jgi:hypothetical protein